jgi:glucose-6-phosphate isomerase
MKGSRHQPTETTRAQVSALKSYGITHEEIGRFLDISHDTLTFHYSRELATAETNANAEVARSLFRKATKKEDVTAMIFWLKTRAGWRDKDKEDDTNEKILEEVKKLREELDAKNKKEF